MRIAKCFLALALANGMASTQFVQATPVSFTGNYTNSFDNLGPSGTTLPAGFRTLILAGGNGTYTATYPITPAAIAGAAPSGTQTLIPWASGSTVTASGSSLFNCGSVGNNADRALGSDPTGVGAMVIELSLANNTGSNLLGVVFVYDCKCLTNGSGGNGTEAAELPGYSFFYSLTGSTSAADWTQVAALSIPNYTQGTVSNSGNIAIAFPTPLTNNGILYFRWADDNCMSVSPDQMLAIDNIGITSYAATNSSSEPVVSITSPANNAAFTSGSNITLTAPASEPGGTITNVAFYANASMIGSAANASYSLNWPGVPAGNYALTAVASDSMGISVTSSVVNITVVAPHVPPSVSLSSPTNNAVFNMPAIVSLSATASDSAGTVTNVAFYQGATQLASVSTAPYSFAWSNVSAGPYTITAVATDNTGASATSSVVNITVTNLLALQTVRQIKTVFMIGMENHNFTQPIPGSSPQQILGNPAAPYLNSLITPGNSNAVQVSYATKYYNVGHSVHPSEPNYVWAEAGTDFGVDIDANPNPASNNIFNAPHLTRQLNAAGIPWKNYQEDIQFGANPTADAVSTSATAINPYYGTGQYGYAARHNPMGFFTDTQTQNVFALTNLAGDLANQTVGRYNWITPNQFNDMHSALNGGFTYQGVSYVGDQAAVAQGDNFLATIIPIIMASPAYQDHGVIIIRWDETEGGDGPDHTIPEIIISPMAKGNAYASSLEMSHSSDVKTMDEIFGLPLLTNAIPSNDINAAGTGYNNVSTVNDLSDMFTGVSSMYVQQPAGANLANGISTIALGTVAVGTNAARTFVVTNAGVASLILSGFGMAGSNPGDFSVSGISLPAALSFGGSLTFQVTFSPVAGGARSASLLITNNDSSHNPFIVNLSGNGNTPPVLSVPSTIYVQATNETINAASYTVTSR